MIITFLQIKFMAQNQNTKFRQIIQKPYLNIAVILFLFSPPRATTERRLISANTYLHNYNQLISIKLFLPYTDMINAIRVY